MSLFDPSNVEAFKSIVEAVAIAVSGLWIAWTFHRLQSVKAAEANILNNLRTADKNAAETQEADRRLVSQQPSLDIQFLEVVGYSFEESDGGSFIGLTIELSNLGARNLIVQFDKSSLTLARFELSDVNLRKMSNLYRSGVCYFAGHGPRLAELPWRILRTGQRRQIVLLAPTPVDGLYLVQFQALYYVLPFDTEEPEEAQGTPIQGMQQRLVRVPLSDATGDSEPRAARRPMTRSRRGNPARRSLRRSVDSGGPIAAERLTSKSARIAAASADVLKRPQGGLRPGAVPGSPTEGRRKQAWR